jgi:hypothetical protein
MAIAQKVKGGYMMKKWFKCFVTSAFIVMMAIVPLGSATVYAQTVTEGRDTGLSFGKYEVDRVEFFNDFDVGGDVGSQTFFVYTDTTPFGTDTATGGEVKTLRYTESMAVTVGSAVKGSTTIDWIIEGRFGTSSQYASIASGTLSVATTVDVLTNITSNPEAIRVGLKSVTAGTDTVDVYGLFRRLKP